MEMSILRMIQFFVPSAEFKSMPFTLTAKPGNPKSLDGSFEFILVVTDFTQWVKLLGIPG